MYPTVDGGEGGGAWAGNRFPKCIFELFVNLLLTCLDFAF